MNHEKNPLPNETSAFETRDKDLYHTLNSIIVPRPIAFVTTKGESGVINAAPFSYFNIVCTEPAMLSIAVERRGLERKDTSRNILFLKEFVVNICSLGLAKAVTTAGKDFPPHISEVEIANLSLIPSQIVSVPRIANTLAQLECVLDQVVEIGNQKSDLILGTIVKVHLHKDILLADGKVDFKKLNPIARLAGPTYGRVSDFFDISRE